MAIGGEAPDLQFSWGCHASSTPPNHNPHLHEDRSFTGEICLGNNTDDGHLCGIPKDCEYTQDIPQISLFASKNNSRDHCALIETLPRQVQKPANTPGVPMMKRSAGSSSPAMEDLSVTPTAAPLVV